MIIRLDPSAPGTPGEQLVTQIVASISAGDLVAGDRLPTIRSLAADLGLAAGTVARAYAELEREGWIVTQGRRGTAVADRGPDAAADQLASAAAAFADVAVRSRLGVLEAHRALDVAFARRARVDEVRPSPARLRDA